MFFARCLVFLFCCFKSSPWLKKTICACDVKGSRDSIMTLLCGEPSMQSACVFFPPFSPLLALKRLKTPVSYLPRLQSRWVDHGENKLRCCSSWDKVTDHMELGSFQTLQPVSFKLALQKPPRRSGQIKAVVKGERCILDVCFVWHLRRGRAQGSSRCQKNSCLPETMCTNPFQATLVKTVLFKVIILDSQRSPSFLSILCLAVCWLLKKNTPICSFMAFKKGSAKTLCLGNTPFVMSQRATRLLTSHLPSETPPCSRFQ